MRVRWRMRGHGTCWVKFQPCSDPLSSLCPHPLGPRAGVGPAWQRHTHTWDFPWMETPRTRVPIPPWPAPTDSPALCPFRRPDRCQLLARRHPCPVPKHPRRTCFWNSIYLFCGYWPPRAVLGAFSWGCSGGSHRRDAGHQTRLVACKADTLSSASRGSPAPGPEDFVFVVLGSHLVVLKADS